MHIELNRMVTYAEFLEAKKVTPLRNRIIPYSSPLVGAGIVAWAHWYALMWLLVATFVIFTLLEAFSRYWVFPSMFKREFNSEEGGTITLTGDELHLEEIGLDLKICWSR